MSELTEVFRESFGPIIELMKQVKPENWAGAATTVLTLALLMTLHTHNLIFAGQKKKVERAQALGHTVTAHCVNTKVWDREGKRRRYYYIYEYELNGEVLHETLDSERVLPDRIRFLYDDRTGKIFPPNSGKGNYGKLLIPLISFLAGGLVTQLFK